MEINDLLGELLKAHGPAGVALVAVIVFVRGLFQGGLAITVRHDPTQVADTLAKLEVAIGEPVTQLARRVKRSEEDIADLQGATAANAIRIDERTKRRTTSTSSLAAKPG